MSSSPDQRWYVVQTHVHSEHKAAANLTRQGYDIYLPRYLKRRRHARRVDHVSSPLFPRYMFVAFDRLSQRWSSIQSTFGVSHLICHGGTPATVPDAVVIGLKAREDSGGFITLDRLPRFSPGDQVRIADGAFASCLGLFQDIADRDRVSILLDLLGRKVRVVLDMDLVTAV